MRRINAVVELMLCAALFVLCLTWVIVSVHAEVTTSNSISVTSTSQTLTIGSVTGNQPVDVLVVNDSTSANEMYYRLFSCGETAAAATTSSIRLEKGESRSYRHSQSEPGAGYCAISLVCANTETATARVEWK